MRRLEREKSERENDRRRRLVRVDVDLVAMSNSSEAISYRDQWIDPNGPALRICRRMRLNDGRFRIEISP